jgi:hypothetical protein
MSVSLAINAGGWERVIGERGDRQYRHDMKRHQNWVHCEIATSPVAPFDLNDNSMLLTQGWNKGRT